MTLEFYRRDFFFQRQIPASSPRFWISDFPSPPIAGTGAYPLVLPPWVPRKAYIAACRLRVEGGINGQLALAIDHGSVAYLTGTPPWHQINSDFRRNTTILSLNSGLEDYREFRWPALLDRDAGDRLWLQLDSNAAGIYTMILSLLFPATGQPSVVTPAGWVPVADWAEALNGDTPGAGELDNGGWSPGYTALTAIKPQGIDLLGGVPTDWRFTFRAGNGGSAVLQKVYAGPSAGDEQNASSLVQCLCAGNPNATIPAGEERTFTLGGTFDSAAGAVVKFYTAGGDGVLRVLQNQPAWHSYHKAGDDAANPVSAGFTMSAYRAVGLRRVEALF